MLILLSVCLTLPADVPGMQLLLCHTEVNMQAAEPKEIQTLAQLISIVIVN